MSTDDSANKEVTKISLNKWNQPKKRSTFSQLNTSITATGTYTQDIHSLQLCRSFWLILKRGRTKCSFYCSSVLWIDWIKCSTKGSPKRHPEDGVEQKCIISPWVLLWNGPGLKGWLSYSWSVQLSYGNITNFFWPSKASVGDKSWKPIFNAASSLFELCFHK